MASISFSSLMKDSNITFWSPQVDQSIITYCSSTSEAVRTKCFKTFFPAMEEMAEYIVKKYYWSADAGSLSKEYAYDSVLNFLVGALTGYNIQEVRKGRPYSFFHHTGEWGARSIFRRNSTQKRSYDKYTCFTDLETADDHRPEELFGTWDPEVDGNEAEESCTALIGRTKQCLTEDLAEMRQKMNEQSTKIRIREEFIKLLDTRPDLIYDNDTDSEFTAVLKDSITGVTRQWFYQQLKALRTQLRHQLKLQSPSYHFEVGETVLIPGEAGRQGKITRLTKKAAWVKHKGRDKQTHHLLTSLKRPKRQGN